MNSNSIAGVILGGGEGKRLGGVAKPLLRVGGVSILDSTLGKLRPYAAPLLISIGRIDAVRFAGFEADALVSDGDDVSGGPLAGIFAATAWLQKRKGRPDWLLSTAGDCPELPQDLPVRLLAAADPGVDVVFASYAGQSYPPNALWRFEGLAAQMTALGGDPQGRGPRQLVAPTRRRDVDFSRHLEVNPFEGLNELGDLVALAQARRQGKSA